ncbi:hypothetical protein [Microbacterium sp. NPDC076911]|uniref:hypothetical protein n=1 Tax=Microbacterium sp. NPDC076911 TaxID=3154958 RepID=UPI003424FBCE
MPKLRSLLVPIALTIGLTGLAACAPSTQPSDVSRSSDTVEQESDIGRGETDDVDEDATDEDADDGAVSERVDCAGSAVTVANSAAGYALHGVCPQVTIEGNDLEVALEEAEVGSIVMRGDRIDIDAGDISSASKSGQSNRVDATSIGSLDIAGSRNEADIDGVLGSVAINGDDNKVHGREIGDVSDSGSRNEIRRD